MTLALRSASRIQEPGYDHVYRIKDHLTTSAAALVPSQQRRCEFTDKLCASFQNFFFLNKLAALLQLVQKLIRHPYSEVLNAPGLWYV